MPVPSAAADEAIRQRRLVDDLAASIDKLTLFVNTFESQLKSKMAVVHARAYQLERQVGFLDRRIQAVTTDPQDKFAHDPYAHTDNHNPSGGLDTAHGSLGDLLAPQPHALASSSSSTAAVPILGAPPPPPIPPPSAAAAWSPTPTSPPTITSLDSPPGEARAPPLAIPVISPTHPVADPPGTVAASEAGSPASFVDAASAFSPGPQGPPLGSLPRPPVTAVDGLPPPPPLAAVVGVVATGGDGGLPPLPPPPPPPPAMLDMPLDDLPLPPPPPPPPTNFDADLVDMGTLPLPPPPPPPVGF